ncbi:MAG: molybdenum cofactor biosynthesis protein MoaE [Thioalkalispiraceae bacterium]|jgi:molybdopterin synthase catalytic subunit
MLIKLFAEAFEPYQLLQDYQQRLASGQYGATAVFVGSMRDFNEGDDVQKMWLEHYPGMTEKHLEKIAHEAMQKWDLLDVLLVHRVGEIGPGEPIVLVAAWSAHRAAAFEASRYLMEELKSRAPFWKKEQLDNSSRWVAKNTPG